MWSGPLNVIRRDPLAGGCLMTYAGANERSSYINAPAPLNVIRRSDSKSLIAFLETELVLCFKC